MEFRISDTFIDSLNKLTNQEQKVVKTTVFDLQINPANPGLQFHKLDRAQDTRFASVRVNRDIRLIVHRSSDSFLVCYVGHHDNAYQWAERRKLETHPTTGAAQLVEVRETVEEIIIPSYIVGQKAKLFDHVSDENLLKYGVPTEWLEDVRNANEDSLLELADHLPVEAAEALLELATGGAPIVTKVAISTTDPFEHPDALRRFRVMSEVEDLALALEYPWEKWTVFLHPDQKQTVTANYAGPARVYGSAGTGKTIVAIHRAAYLAETYEGSRVLLATFSETLANALGAKLRRLLFNRPRLGDQIEVYSMNALGERLYKLNIGNAKIASVSFIESALKKAATTTSSHQFSLKFLMTEWNQVVDAWQVITLESYLSIPRLGRNTRLRESQRSILWSIFEKVQSELNAQSLITYAGMFDALTKHYSERASSPFDFIVIDESQDISVAQLKFIAALCAQRPNGLFFAGDQGQRIFQRPFSWKHLGVDVRGRSKSLRINYRTSHQIRTQADKLLGSELSDVDGNVEKRRGTISVFNGPQPVIRDFDTTQDENQAVIQWINDQLDAGIEPQEIGVFVRSEHELARAESALKQLSQPFKVLDGKVAISDGHIALCDMHLAKGLEFRAVVVMACDDEVIPSQERIASASDEADLEEVYNSERHLLYVACTRARDKLLVTSVKPASEFLDDLRI